MIVYVPKKYINNESDYGGCDGGGGDEDEDVDDAAAAAVADDDRKYQDYVHIKWECWSTM